LATRERAIALQRRQAHDLAMVTAVVSRRLLLSIHQERTMWVRPRSHAFFREIVCGWDDTEWKRNFRVGRPTLRFLCLQLASVLQRREVVRKPLSVEVPIQRSAKLGPCGCGMCLWTTEGKMEMFDEKE